MVPLPKEYKYRITCTVKNNQQVEYSVDEEKSYTEKVWKSIFVRKEVERIYYNPIERDEYAYPKKYLTREDALKAIDRHYGNITHRVEIEYIVKK